MRVEKKEYVCVCVRAYILHMLYIQMNKYAHYILYLWTIINIWLLFTSNNVTLNRDFIETCPKILYIQYKYIMGAITYPLSTLLYFHDTWFLIILIHILPSSTNYSFYSLTFINSTWIKFLPDPLMSSLRNSRSFLSLFSQNL